MQPRTQAHLAKAEAYRAVAQSLAQNPPAQPPVGDWAVVAAFYAALHYVNAFLFETTGEAPEMHPRRRQAMDRTQIARAKREYWALEDRAWQVRYTPDYVLGATDLATAVQKDLETVRRVVRAALKLPPSE